ncbi:MAG TPA: OmpH family outer membrane protein [Puia sp.]|nr:OmpH family outer membrane protein [Puia sp.]
MRQFIQPASIKPRLIILIFIFAGFAAPAQTHIGYISMSELIEAMPEYKKADSAMANYQNALNDQYQDMAKEVNEKDSILSGPDTIRMTREQLDVSRRAAAELVSQTRAFYQQMNPLLQQKQEELLAPIRKKANALIWQLAKEHGYTYVLLKEAIAVYPLTDDLMPYAKLKLGIK